jgi:hypothetical protein
MAAEGLAAAIAGVARVRPDFAPAAARHTHASNRHVERNGDTVKGFAWRQVQLGRELAAAIVIGRRNETGAHAFDRTMQRRKIDRNLIVEPRVRARERHREHAFRGSTVVTWANGVVPHRLSYDRVATAGCQGKRRVLASRANMDQRECPVCGERMRLQTREQTDRVPGTREVKTKAVREWVCPECDHFEEVEES